jgi:hypothetical protein
MCLPDNYYVIICRDWDPQILGPYTLVELNRFFNDEDDEGISDFLPDSRWEDSCPEHGNILTYDGIDGAGIVYVIQGLPASVTEVGRVIKKVMKVVPSKWTE